jgi:hypothetical protein
MDKDLRAILEQRGLLPTASDDEAKAFFDAMSLEQKGAIGTEMAQRGWDKGERPESHISTRADGGIVTRDITTRGFSLRAESADEETRSVEAVIATDQPVTVYDYRTGELIDEVLRMDGLEVPVRVPMLANHSRWSLDDVFGSARSIEASAHEVKGRLHFARDVDSDKAWQKVKDGHLSDVSAGYRVDKYTDVRPGQSAVVGGKTYTAKGRTLRISTQWALREVSLVPIGADSRSKIRADQPQEVIEMKKALRKYLESIGLRAEATDDEAKTFLAGLDGEQKTRAEAIEAETDQRSATVTTPAAPPTEPIARTETVDPAEVARQAVIAERDRVRKITELAGSDVSADLRSRAINEGWDEGRAAPEFLAEIRRRGPETQTNPVPYFATAQTVKPSSINANSRSLAAGLMIAAGISDPTKFAFHNGRRTSPTDKFTAQDAEIGHRMARMSAADLLRECVRQDTGRLYWDVEEAMEAQRSSPSGGTLTSVFSASVYAKLVEGWEEEPDTTVWCESEDVANFLDQDDISIEGSSNLKILPRGGTATHASLSDSKETYSIARFAKQFVVDEQDVIDDRLGAIMRMPMQMGNAARRLRPDLVYSILLANPTMTDTGALFNSTAVTTAGGHANLTTAVLGSTGLKAGIEAMGAYRTDDNAVLNIRPKFLIVPAALQWTAMELLTSTNHAYTAAAAAATPSEYYTINVLNGVVQTLVVDDRIGATGCWNPTTQAVVAGAATKWFLSAGGPRTIRVAYRRGTNRMPQLRSFVLDKGQWGIGWDINMDIGAAAMDYRGLHYSAGTG